jgi:MFS family permease
MFVAGGLLSSPVSLYGGAITDRFGRRGLAISSAVASTAGYAILFACVQLNLPVLFIAAAVIGSSVPTNMQYVVIQTIVTDVSQESQRLSAFSLVRILSNAGIGSGLIASGLAWNYDPSIFFIVPVLLGIIDVLLFIKYIPESHSTAERVKTEISFSRDRFLVYISLVMTFSFVLANQFENSAFPIYMSSHNGFPTLLITVLYAVNTLVVIFLQYAINALSTKIGIVRAFASGILLYAAADLVFATVSYYYLIVAAVVVLTLGENMMSPVGQTIIARIAPEEKRGSYFGTYSAISGVGFTFSPMIGTSLLQTFSATPEVMWYVLALACLVMSIVSSRALREK